MTSRRALPPLVCVPRLVGLSCLFPGRGLSHNISVVLQFHSFRQIFHRTLSFALISPQSRNGEIPPLRQDAFLFLGYTLLHQLRSAH